MADESYTGGLGGDWFDPANWSGGMVPAPGDLADLFGTAGADARVGGTISGVTVDLSGAAPAGSYYDPSTETFYAFTPGLFADTLGTSAAPVTIEATNDSGLGGLSGAAFTTLNGSMTVGAGQRLDVSGVGPDNSVTINGDVTVGAGANLAFEGVSAFGYPDPLKLTMNGRLFDNGGNVALYDYNTTGSGQIVIADGGAVAEETVFPIYGFDLGTTFGAGGGSLNISPLFGGYAGTISGFGAGDTVIDYDPGGAQDPVETSYADGVLTITSDTTETLSFSGNYTVANFDVTKENSALYVTWQPCFARGTAIACDDGDRAVEDLTTGDRVRLARGGVSEVVWVGTRRQRGADVVHFRVGSLGRGVPRRDLVVSVDHGMFVEGVLVPAELLVNGTSIVRERRESVTFFHVELTRHDVLLAEGAPAESYLDTGNRAQFGNCPFSYEPMDAAWVEPCAEMVFGGTRLDAIKAGLAAPA